MTRYGMMWRVMTYQLTVWSDVVRRAVRRKHGMARRRAPESGPPAALDIGKEPTVMETLYVRIVRLDALADYCVQNRQNYMINFNMCTKASFDKYVFFDSP